MIIVKLSVKDLQKDSACEEGIAFFKKHANQSGNLQVEWTLQEQIKWLKLGARFTTWAMAHSLIPCLPMYDVDLSRANLSRADLSYANLSGAYLSRANLSYANLSGANLYYANLYGANLSRANLYYANLYGANLYGANLSGACGFVLPEGWELIDGIARRKPSFSDP